MAYEIVALSPHSSPQFGLATAASEHLMWESNPALGDYVTNYLNHMVLGNKIEKLYAPLPDDPGRLSPQASERREAYRKTMEEYVRPSATVRQPAASLSAEPT